MLIAEIPTVSAPRSRSRRAARRSAPPALALLAILLLVPGVRLARAQGTPGPEQVGPGATRLPPVTQAILPRPSGPEESELRVARLKYGGGGDWYCDPSSIPNWLDAFASRTGIPTARDEAVVSLDSEDLYRYPILWVTGHGRIALDDRELAELRRYLDAGGFLWADDCYGLDPSFRELAKRLYPDSPLVRLGSDHPIYRAYYDLPGLPKIHQHDGLPAQGFGVFHRGRLVVFYSFSSDIGDGIEDPDVHGDPPDVREAAAEMAVNVFMYVLTHP